MLKDREKEIEKMAKKMVLLDPGSLHIVNVLADGLYARHQMELTQKKDQELNNAKGNKRIKDNQ